MESKASCRQGQCICEARRVCGPVPVEVVHGVTGVAGDLVETLSSAHRFLDGVLVIHYFII